MNKKLLKIYSCVSLVILLFACSDKNKTDFTNPIVYLNNFGTSWTIYGDYLNVADCAIKYYVVNSNSSADFQYRKNGNTAIKIYWDGGIVDNKNYYGFYLELAKAKDLSTAGYNRLKFVVKGSLGTDVLEVKPFNQDDDKYMVYASQINATTYTEITVPITASLSDVKYLLGFDIKSTNRIDLNGDAATIYIDNIQLVNTVS